MRSNQIAKRLIAERIAEETRPANEPKDIEQAMPLPSCPRCGAPFRHKLMVFKDRSVFKLYCEYCGDWDYIRFRRTTTKLFKDCFSRLCAKIKGAMHNGQA